MDAQKDRPQRTNHGTVSTCTRLHSTLQAVHFKLHSEHFIVCTLHCLNTPGSTLHTLRTLHSTVPSQSPVSLHSTLHSKLSTPLSRQLRAPHTTLNTYVGVHALRARMSYHACIRTGAPAHICIYNVFYCKFNHDILLYLLCSQGCTGWSVCIRRLCFGITSESPLPEFGSWWHSIMIFFNSEEHIHQLRLHQ